MLPDYTKPVPEVFIDVTEFQLIESKDLLVLSLVENSIERHFNMLPSWVPDYSIGQFQTLGVQKRRLFSATGDLSLDWKIKERGLLTLHAVEIDDLTCVGENKIEWETAWENPQWLAILGRMDDVYMTGENKLEAFWRALIEDSAGTEGLHDPEGEVPWIHPAPTSLAKSFQFRLHVQAGEAIISAKKSKASKDCSDAIFATLDRLSAMFPSSMVPQADQVCQFVDEFLEHPKSTSYIVVGRVERKYVPYSQALMEVCAARFFRTRTGFMGTGPLWMEAGDSVWLVPGAEVFLILREKSDRDRFQLVGDAYVHGLMHGEACEDVEREFKTVVIERLTYSLEPCLFGHEI